MNTPTYNISINIGTINIGRSPAKRKRQNKQQIMCKICNAVVATLTATNFNIPVCASHHYIAQLASQCLPVGYTANDVKVKCDELAENQAAFVVASPRLSYVVNGQQRHSKILLATDVRLIAEDTIHDKKRHRLYDPAVVSAYNSLVEQNPTRVPSPTEVQSQVSSAATP